MKCWIWMLIALVLPLAAPAQNLARGKEINETCAACHGELGQGGKKGEYPRLAGQRAAHLADQLKAFRKRSRINIPMYPYTQERELSDGDIDDVTAYLAQIELPMAWPEFKPTDDALTRLTLTERVMILPRAPGDLDNGARLYKAECAACHGKDGMGRGKFPRLVGQYTAYLKRQVELFVKGDRPHDEVELKGILNTLPEAQVQDILAYLTLIQNPAEVKP
ncbi:MAG: c-type cytochrome [Rubrivivax sp.]